MLLKRTEPTFSLPIGLNNLRLRKTSLICNQFNMPLRAVYPLFSPLFKASTAICQNFALQSFAWFHVLAHLPKNFLHQLCILGMFPCLFRNIRLGFLHQSVMLTSLLWNLRSWTFCLTRFWISELLKFGYFSMKVANPWNSTINTALSISTNDS